MLLSHSRQFIFFKTRKTASTSTEIFFEPHCVQDPGHIPSRSTQQLISSAGIVGSRRDGVTDDDLFFNSMPAVDVLARVGADVFNGYLKFCNVRNPFDKMVSRFWWILSQRGRSTEYMTMSFDEVRHQFNNYIARSPAELLDNDRPSFFIDDESVADRYIRYEHLAEDIESICSYLDVDYDGDRMGRYNSGVRHISEPSSAFYDDASADKVARIFAWDIAMFGYKL